MSHHFPHTKKNILKLRILSLEYNKNKKRCLFLFFLKPRGDTLTINMFQLRISFFSYILFYFILF